MLERFLPLFSAVFKRHAADIGATAGSNREALRKYRPVCDVETRSHSSQVSMLQQSLVPLQTTSIEAPYTSYTYPAIFLSDD